MADNLKFLAVNRKRQEAAAKKQQAFLDCLLVDPSRTINDICHEIEINPVSYQGWRARNPKFAADVATVRSNAGFATRSDKEHAVEPFKGSFIEMRKYYFGYDTPWFQAVTVDAYRRAGPGSIVLALQPPEHGKTSLTEDDLSLEIAQRPNIRITAISEGQTMARKMSNRLMKRVSPEGPFPDFVRDHGPFAPQRGSDGANQPWSVDAWSVWGAAQSDERDYTFATGGWRSTIAGTRADRLHVDDMQSLRSLELTEKMWEIFRQDMLSRPGERGRTTLNGTRVGDQDFYQKMDDEFAGEDFYQKIEFPAIVIDQLSGEPTPLWEAHPDLPGVGYTMEQLERLRKKVGEEAWWRNYMQKPRTSTFIVFTDDGIEKSKNHLRSTTHTRHDLPDIANDEAWITVDPSIGGINVTMAMHPEPAKLLVLDIKEDTGLANNNQIAKAVDDMAHRISARGWKPTMLVIEAMAFQKGLMADENVLEVAKRWGMRIESHMTGINKYDENIGVPSMASSVDSGLIDLPYSSNYDRAITDQLCAQMHAWKPTRDRNTGKLKFKRGNQLRQDQLMTLWFGWIWWTEMRAGRSTGPDPSEAFSRGGLPYRPTRTGLLVPAH